MKNEPNRKERLKLRQKKFRRGVKMRRKVEAVLHEHNKRKQKKRPPTRAERQAAIDAEKLASKALRSEFV